jgi:hypothetical protein
LSTTQQENINDINKEKLNKALYKPVIGVENGGRMNIAPALVRACSDVSKDIMNNAQFGFLGGNKM